MDDKRIKVSVGKGKFKYMTADEIFNDSDSGDDFDSDVDDESPVSELVIIPSSNQLETSPSVLDPDDELNELLRAFDDNNPVLPPPTVESELPSNEILESSMIIDNIPEMDILGNDIIFSTVQTEYNI